MIVRLQLASHRRASRRSTRPTTGRATGRPAAMVSRGARAGFGRRRAGSGQPAMAGTSSQSSSAPCTGCQVLGRAVHQQSLIATSAAANLRWHFSIAFPLVHDHSAMNHHIHCHNSQVIDYANYQAAILTLQTQ